MHNWKPKLPNWRAHSAIFCIRCYQAIRPMLDGVVLGVFGWVSACPQNPTCSQFTINAIKDHGTIAGVTMGIKRVISCKGKLSQLKN